MIMIFFFILDYNGAALHGQSSKETLYTYL